MSQIKYLVLFLFLLAAYSSSEAATWVSLGKSVDSKLSLDKDSVIEEGKYKKSWVKVEYQTPQKNPDSVDKVYNMARVLWYFDCAAQKSATTQVFQYLNQELVYSAAVDVKNAAFQEPQPDSDVEIAMRYTCKKPKVVHKAAPKKVETPVAAQKNDAAATSPNNPPATPAVAPTATPKVEKTKPENAKKEKPEAISKDGKAEHKADAANDKKSSTHGVEWAYSGKNGPDKWADLSSDYMMCGLGQNQSPINIQATTHAALKPLKMVQRFAAKNIVNNGHTIQVNFKDGNIVAVDKILFRLKQVHFHAPSENTINGKSFPLEAHFVHADNAGHLTVIAVMFEIGEANPIIEKLWSQIPDEENKEVNLKGLFTPDTLMPKQKQYYRFSGSLTTPPCSEGVRWIVMKTPLTVSKTQVAIFEKALHHHNNRPVQSLNSRVVLE
jgi:carbonic anhydrase